MTLFDFNKVFACFAVYLDLGKIPLMGRCSSLPSSFNTRNVSVAFPFQQLCRLLNISIESLVYMQEAGLGCTLLILTTQPFGCFSFQFPLIGMVRKGCVNDMCFQNTCIVSR